MAMHTYGTETLNAETQRLGVQGQPGIDRETLYPKSKTQAMQKAAEGWVKIGLLILEKQ